MIGTGGESGDRSGRRITSYEYWGIAAIVLALVWRAWLTAQGVPRFDSDEGTMGLMALHILRGARPVFFYGQAYMGAMEAYLAAPLFGLFGPSDVALRMAPLALTALFLITMYFVSALLYGRKTAVVSIILLGIGSEEAISRQLKAVGGYPELLFFGSAALFAAGYLGVSARDGSRTRLFVFLGFGLACGLGLWSDPLILPIAGTALALLIATCRRELVGRAGVLLLLGLLLGASPAVGYNLAATGGTTTWASVAQIARSGGSGHVSTGSSALSQRLAGLVAVTVPVMTGGNGLCRIAPQDAWPLSAPSAHTTVCTGAHVLWGGVWIAFLLAAAALAITALRRLGARASLVTQEAWGLAAGRLAVPAAALAVLLLYLLTPAPAHAPWYTVRYVTGVLIGLPALVWVLHGLPRRAAWLGRLALLLIVLGALLDSVSTLRNASYDAWLRSQEGDLSGELASNGIRHVYSDYWTCDLLAFETRERITCAALDETLRSGLDRYRAYRPAVRADPRAAIVFRQGTPQLRREDLRLRQTSRYARIVGPLYVAFIPARGYFSPGSRERMSAVSPAAMLRRAGYPRSRTARSTGTLRGASR